MRKSEADSAVAIEQETDLTKIRGRLEEHFATIKLTFEELERTRAMELLIQNKERGNYLMNYYVKVIGMTSSHYILKHEELLEGNFEAATVIFEEAGQIMDFGAMIPISLTKGVERIVLIGDDNQLPPLVKNPILQTVANLQQSMFARLLNHNYQRVNLRQQGRCRSEIASLFSWKYAGLANLPHIATDARLNEPVKGMKHAVQFINVSSTEVSMKFIKHSPVAGYYQNLEEAELAVAIFMYLVLQGYSRERIVILTTYKGQKDLICEIVNKKAAWHEQFGSPSRVATIDKYQGQHNDIVILSLVRTKSPGFIIDEKRLVVALSRASLGLFILGNVELFRKQKEFEVVFENLKDKGHELRVANSEGLEESVSSSADLYAINKKCFQKASSTKES